MPWFRASSDNMAAKDDNSETCLSVAMAKGALALSGMPDAQSKPVLLCSLNDNTVRLYDLPSFSDRGRLFSKKEIRAIQMGPGGLFFTGDGTGELKVWQWVDLAQT
ncbi:Zinc finger CCCH domain-containing protein 48 [Zea mays]|uniref:Zinc finger CCCH domain-containing protein 48 n=1 Tax=Zea mays TaxID=4577 RepID=A0A1D6HFW8_MAIZE|nr:Zinc finger CCCH domain-containing protein 48 [Zea mays]